MADEAIKRPENAYEAAMAYQDRLLERGRTGKVLIRDEDRPWEATRQGRIRYFLNAAMYGDTALQEWRVFSQEIRTQSGKHRHQGGVAIYILEGKGYTVADGKRYDWEKGDLLTLPVKPGGVEHQHFNTNPDGPSRWMAFVYVPLANHVALHLKQIEVAPGQVQPRGHSDE
ncbi:MAG TPA: cupin domain-containing protein [Verrucomicrobiae bacterium]|nr:cupin domain-containing protein [Verrucomicrobiae bacterium]